MPQRGKRDDVQPTAAEVAERGTGKMLDDRKLDEYAQALAASLAALRWPSLPPTEALAVLEDMYLAPKDAAAVLSYGVDRGILKVVHDHLSAGPAASSAGSTGGRG